VVGSVVTKDVDVNSIAAGNSAKLIRRRFSERVCERIEESPWCENELSGLKEEMPLLGIAQR
jgi:hypothetical protein